MLKSDCGSIGLPFQSRLKSFGVKNRFDGVGLSWIADGFCVRTTGWYVNQNHPAIRIHPTTRPIRAWKPQAGRGNLDRGSSRPKCGRHNDWPFGSGLGCQAPGTGMGTARIREGTAELCFEKRNADGNEPKRHTRHAVWGFEFAFKPARVIEVDYPTPGGKLRRKLVWYMIYRVRYLGGDLEPTLAQTEDLVGIPTTPKEVRYKSVRFIPRFTLPIPDQNRVRLASHLHRHPADCATGTHRKGTL